MERTRSVSLSADDLFSILVEEPTGMYLADDLVRHIHDFCDPHMLGLKQRGKVGCPCTPDGGKGPSYVASVLAPRNRRLPR